MPSRTGRTSSQAQLSHCNRGRRPEQAAILELLDSFRTQESKMSSAIPDDRRKTIFLALVTAQDEGQRVAQSRQSVAKEFGVTERQVRLIEQEGLNEGWPPL